MAITFRIAEHSVRPGVQLVEILLDGEVVGAIYPDPEKNGIAIISAHFSEKNMPPDFEGEVLEDDGRGSFPPIPFIRLTFRPRKYVIVRGEIQYLE